MTTNLLEPTTEILNYGVARGIIVQPSSAVSAKRTDPSSSTASGNTQLTTQQRSNGQPTESDMELIRNLVPNPAEIKPEQFYVFDTYPSNQTVDSYLTQMDISSLRNYVEDAKAGVSVMNSHRTGNYSSYAELPIGRSFWGALEPDPDNAGLQRMVSSAFLLRGNRANGSVNTDDVIAAIQGGVVRDISIGFRLVQGTAQNDFKDRSWHRCSICDRDWDTGHYFDFDDTWSAKDVSARNPANTRFAPAPMPIVEKAEPDYCTHWPGEVYDGKMCTLWVMNARLGEYSPVYKGATDGAVIKKATRAVEAGRLDKRIAQRYEQAYGVRIWGSQSYPTPQRNSNSKEEQKPMSAAANASPEQQQRAANNKPAAANAKPKSNAPAKASSNAANTPDQGAQLFAIGFIRQLMASRAMSDDEKMMLESAMQKVAAGDLDAAKSVMTDLMNGNITSSEAGTLDMEAPEELGDMHKNTATQTTSNYDGDGDEDDTMMTTDGANDTATAQGLVGNVQDDGETGLDSENLQDMVDEGQNGPGDQNGTEDETPNQKGKMLQAGNSGSGTTNNTNGAGAGRTTTKPMTKADTLTILTLTNEERQQLATYRRENHDLRRQVDQLTPMALIGEAAYSQAIEETKKEAVRAASGVQPALIERMCRGMDYADILALRASYAEQARKRLGTYDPETGQPLGYGGRATQASDPNQFLPYGPNANNGGNYMPNVKPTEREINSYKVQR